MQEASLKHPKLASSFSFFFLLFFLFYFYFIFIWGVSLTHPVLVYYFFSVLFSLVDFLSEEFLSHIPRWLHFYLRSFSYTSRAGFIFGWEVTLWHSMLALFFCVEFLLHIQCWLHFYLGSFSYTSHAGFITLCLTHPVLALFLCWELLLNIPSWLLLLLLLFFFFFLFFFFSSSFSFLFLIVLFSSYSVFIWRISLTHPVLVSFFLFFFL